MTKRACPQCGEPASLASDNPWRPFCSKRCKLLDLGDWLEERHVIPADVPEDEAPPAAGVPPHDTRH